MNDTTLNVLISSIAGLLTALISSITQIAITLLKLNNSQETEKPKSPRSLLQINWKISLFLAGGVMLIIFFLLSLSFKFFTSCKNSECIYCFIERNGEVVMEAEHYTFQLHGKNNFINQQWVMITNLKGYMGDGALQALPNEGANTGLNVSGPALLYIINFHTTGTYYVYVRGYAPSNNDDSIHIGLAGIPTTTSSQDSIGLSFTMPAFTWQNETRGKRATITVPSPGIYTFYIWMREDGTVIDRIWLSKQSELIPDDNTSPGPPESPYEVLKNNLQ